MTDIQQVMALFTFLFGALLALQIYHHRQIRQDMRDMSRRIEDRFDQIERRFERIEDRFDQVDRRFERVDDRFGRVEDDIKILINDVGELKGAAGVSTSSREREPIGTGD